MPGKMKWFLLYISPKAEKKVATRLQLEGINVYLPLHLSPRKWSDRIKLVEMPLFPGYLFVQTEREGLYKAVMVPGVARIVYFEGAPVEVRDSEIKAIQQFVEHAAGKECFYELGEEVKIAFGPMEGRIGKIKKIKGKYIVLVLNHLGLTARVNLDQLTK